MATINHYGITVNTEEPITGVLSINQVSIQSLYDAMDYEDGINLDEEERLNEFKSNPFDQIYEIDIMELSEDAQKEIDRFITKLEYKLEQIEFYQCSEDTREELLQCYYDSSESYPDDTWLIGDWIEDDNGQHEPDKTGEYAAIVNENTIQVVWSKHTIRVRSLCSPCYPGQADICTDSRGQPVESESENGFLAYNLPSEFFEILY